MAGKAWITSARAASTPSSSVPSSSALSSGRPEGRKSKRPLRHRLVVEVQVGGIELAQFLQPIPVENRQFRARELDKPGCSKFHQCPIDVHRRDTQRIAKLRLCHREVALVVFGKAHCPHLDHELAHDMRKSIEGFATPDVYDPLAEDCRVDERLTPERPCDLKV